MIRKDFLYSLCGRLELKSNISFIYCGLVGKYTSGIRIPRYSSTLHQILNFRDICIQTVNAMNQYIYRFEALYKFPFGVIICFKKYIKVILIKVFVFWVCNSNLFYEIMIINILLKISKISVINNFLYWKYIFFFKRYFWNKYLH